MNAQVITHAVKLKHLMGSLEEGIIHYKTSLQHLISASVSPRRVLDLLWLPVALVPWVDMKSASFNVHLLAHSLLWSARKQLVALFHGKVLIKYPSVSQLSRAPPSSFPVKSRKTFTPSPPL